MNQMINEAILKQLTINEFCYEDNCDDEGSPYWNPDDIADTDEFSEIVLSFSLTTPPKKGLRKTIYNIGDHPILYGEVIALINTIDLDKLAAEVESERDSCAVWNETHSYNFGGY